MRRDLDPIELPPPAEDYGGLRTNDDMPGQPGDVGGQPIDNIDIGDDPEHLGASGLRGRTEDDGMTPGIENRGPVHEAPDRDDTGAMARSQDAKSATDSTIRTGTADPSAVDNEPMPVDHKERPVDRDPSA